MNATTLTRHLHSDTSKQVARDPWVWLRPARTAWIWCLSPCALILAFAAGFYSQAVLYGAIASFILWSIFGLVLAFSGVARGVERHGARGVLQSIVHGLILSSIALLVFSATRALVVDSLGFGRHPNSRELRLRYEKHRTSFEEIGKAASLEMYGNGHADGDLQDLEAVHTIGAMASERLAPGDPFRFPISSRQVFGLRTEIGYAYCPIAPETTYPTLEAAPRRKGDSFALLGDGWYLTSRMEY